MSEKLFLLYCLCSCLCTSPEPMSERDRCPQNSCLCPFFFCCSLYFFLPPFCVSTNQRTTPPYCNFCVTHFTNAQKLKPTAGCKVGARSVTFISFHFVVSQTRSLSASSCLFLHVCSSFSYTLDSCSLYCLTSFLPPRSPWGPGSCYLNVFLQEPLE